MKMNILATLVLVAIAVPRIAFAQHEHEHGKTEQAESRQESPMHGTMKPVVEQTVDGVGVKVILITQEEHKSMMKARSRDSNRSTSDGMGHAMMHEQKDSAHADHAMHGSKTTGHRNHGEKMKHDSSNADHRAMMDAMMAGTHHIMVFLTDDKNDAPLENASVTVEAHSPTGTLSTFNLVSMMNHFGGGLLLNEAGIYMITVRFQAGSHSNKVRFTYSAHQ